MKQQLRIPREIWTNMIVTVSNVDMGKKISQPTTYYVKGVEGNSVTLKKVFAPGDGTEVDVDGDFSKDTDDEIIINKDNFWDLCTPIAPPQGDMM